MTMSNNDDSPLRPHRGVINQSWWSELDEKAHQHPVGDQSDHPFHRTPFDYAIDDAQRKVDVGQHAIYHPETLDDLIEVLNEIKYQQFNGRGDIPAKSCIRLQGVQTSLTGLSIDYGQSTDGDSMIIAASDSWLPIEDDHHLTLNQSVNEPDDDERDQLDKEMDEALNAIVEGVKSIHNDDIDKINTLRLNHEDWYRVCKTIDGLIISGSSDYSYDDDSIRLAAIDVLRMMYP